MFKPGTQVAYIPNHANGDINHVDVEFGFITGMSQDNTFAFCRYWSKNSEIALRTTCNSESTPLENLVEYEHVPQGVVNRIMVALGYMYNIYQHQKEKKS